MINYEQIKANLNSHFYIAVEEIQGIHQMTSFVAQDVYVEK